MLRWRYLSEEFCSSFIALLNYFSVLNSVIDSATGTGFKLEIECGIIAANIVAIRLYVVHAGAVCCVRYYGP